jgi:hypothetical protein
MNPEAFRLSAALVGILLLVLLVARFKWHPFLALMFVSWGLAVTCGVNEVLDKSSAILLGKRAAWPETVDFEALVPADRRERDLLKIRL